MKGFLSMAALAALSALSQTAAARDYPYAIQPGLPAVVTVSDLPEQRLSVRVGDGTAQEIARPEGDEEIDQFQDVDVDHDGYRDFVIGQTGGSTQAISRIFLYRPQEGRFREVAHPGATASPCRGFVNPVFDASKPVFSVACRYSADTYGFEEYRVCPDGSAQAISWTLREGESERKIPHPGSKAGACVARPGR
ncbi:XAC2610-related protein [Achromobacter aegrifaciens]